MNFRRNRGGAELRRVGSLFAAAAEAAFSIERPWQSHGVGTELLERTLLTARNRDIKILRMDCLPAVVDAANVLTAILTHNGACSGRLGAPDL